MLAMLKSPAFCSVLHRRWLASVAAHIQRSHVVGAKDIPLTNDTMGIALQQAVERTPDRELCVFVKQNLRKTYSQFLADVDKLAVGLRRVMKLQPGDRIGMWGGNCYEWFLTQYATARIGVVLVCLNPLYQVGELEFAVNKTKCKAVIANTGFRTLNYVSTLQSLLPDVDKKEPGSQFSAALPHLKHIAIVSDKRELRGAYRFAEIAEVDATSDEYASIHNLQKKLDAQDPINIQFTSGTTGSPKGATLTHYNLVNTSMVAGFRIKSNEMNTRILTQLPFYHCFAMVCANASIMSHGTTVVVPDYCFNADASLKTIQQERCTTVLGTPTMYIDMLNHPQLKSFNLSSVRLSIYGGSPVAPSLIQRSVPTLTRQALIGYGMTECCAALSLTPVEHTVDQNLNTVGMLFEHNEAKVVNQNGEIVPVGQPGELWIRGYNVMKGYWDEPDKTRQSMTSDGWFKTGDMAVIRPDKYLQIVGRIKDMIIRGGENVYPAEIEDMLHKHPDVGDVQVVGVPDERLGEEVCAYIKLKDPKKQLQSGELLKWLTSRLARFKLPKYYLFVTSFPMTVTGKIQKFKLREDAIKELKLQNVKRDLKY